MRVNTGSTCAIHGSSFGGQFQTDSEKALVFQKILLSACHSAKNVMKCHEKFYLIFAEQERTCRYHSWVRR